MEKVTETNWARRIEYGNEDSVTIQKHSILNLALTAGGVLAMYGIGRLVGDGVDHIPYLNELIPAAVNYVSGINVSGNIGGLMGLLGGLYGAIGSGITINDKTLKLEKITVTPISLIYEKE